MKIVHVIDDARPIGGAQTYLRRLIAGTTARDIESSVLAGVVSKEGFGGVEVTGFVGAGDDVRAIERRRPDAIVLHNVDSAAFAAKLTAVAPTFLYEHDYRHISPGNLRFFVRSESFCERGFGLRCLVKPYTERCNNRRPDRVVSSIRRVRQWQEVWASLAGIFCASDFVADLMRNAIEPDTRVSVVGYPIDVPATPVGPALGRPHILFVGRTSVVKGLHHLVDAFARLLPTHPGTRLMIAGGPDTASVRDLIAHRRIAEHVDVVGWLDSRELVDLYRRARVLAMPSVWPEPFGMAGPEALAHGVPVVAFDVGGISSWLDAESGTLVPGGDAVALAGALSGRLDDHLGADEAGAAGRTRVIQDFTIERHLDLLLPLLEAAA